MGYIITFLLGGVSVVLGQIFLALQLASQAANAVQGARTQFATVLGDLGAVVDQFLVGLSIPLQ